MESLHGLLVGLKKSKWTATSPDICFSTHERRIEKHVVSHLQEPIGSTCVLLYNYHIVPGDRTDLLRLPRAKHRRDAKHEVLRETTGRLKSCYSSL